VSKLDSLKYQTGRKRTPTCDARFGSFRCGVHLTPPDWLTDAKPVLKQIHDAASGSWVKPTTPNGYYYFCSVAGTVGSTEPTWPTVIGATVSDGSAEWTTIRAHEITDSIDVVTDNKIMTVTGIGSDPAGEWRNGTIEFTSGNLKGVRSTIELHVGNALVLSQPLKNIPSNGDTVKLTKGCRKRFELDCKTKLDNSINFQGSLYTPGDKILSKSGEQS